jgi:hypothetical protein
MGGCRVRSAEQNGDSRTETSSSASWRPHVNVVPTVSSSRHLSRGREMEAGDIGTQRRAALEPLSPPHLTFLLVRVSAGALDHVVQPDPGPEFVRSHVSGRCAAWSPRVVTRHGSIASTPLPGLRPPSSLRKVTRPGRSASTGRSRGPRTRRNGRRRASWRGRPGSRRSSRPVRAAPATPLWRTPHGRAGLRRARR